MFEASDGSGSRRYPGIGHYWVFGFRPDSPAPPDGEALPIERKANCFLGALAIIKRFPLYLPEDKTAIVGVTPIKLTNGTSRMKDVAERVPHAVAYGADSGRAYSFDQRGWRTGQVVKATDTEPDTAQASNPTRVTVAEYAEMLTKPSGLVSLGHRAMDALAQDAEALLFDETPFGQHGRPLSPVFEVSLPDKPKE